MEQQELRTPVRTMLRTDMQDAVVEERVGRRIVGVELSVSNDVAPQSTDKLSTLPRPFLSPTQDAPASRAHALWKPRAGN